MAFLRQCAPQRNHLNLPLWRVAMVKDRKWPASYAVRKLGRKCPGFSEHQAALYADLIGYPREEG